MRPRLLTSHGAAGCEPYSFAQCYAGFQHGVRAGRSGYRKRHQRAQENLLRQQRPDGHWCGELIVDSTLCSDFVLFMHWLGEVDDALQQRCVRHILKRQLPDGGWNIYFGGPSEVNASVKAYFALKLAGHSADLPFMHEARANILRLGGIPKMNTFSKLYLALLDNPLANFCFDSVE